jgi:serine/threonine-protein kinase
VLDFGLVTSAGVVASPSQLTTAEGTIRGTPAYMAPEMALGERVDDRADIYALGCVAYYLLTGQLVFDTDTAMQGLLKRLHEDPVPPSTRTELPIPADLEALVLSCLARHPSARPTAVELRRSLARLNVPEWTADDARGWWALHQPMRPAPVVG